METWRPVVGFEAFYEVSDLGRVRRIVAGGAYRAGRVKSPVISTTRYLMVRLYHGRRAGRTVMVHNAVAAAFLGQRPVGCDVNHKDGNKLNPAATNLEYMTRRQNMEHASRIGLWDYRGSKHRLAKLTDEQAIQIRQRYVAGEKIGPLSREFGVARSQIQNIVHGRSYKHAAIAARLHPVSEAQAVETIAPALMEA